MTLTNLPDRATATPATRSQPGACVKVNEYAPEAKVPQSVKGRPSDFKILCLGALVVIGALTWVDVKRIEHFSALEVSHED